MITPHFSRYRMAWPSSFGDFSTIDTEATNPVWSVPGHYTTPPPEVCDILTAASFDFSFELSASAFNTHYTENLPSSVVFLETRNSGTWYASMNGITEEWNVANVWDTQIKLFEGYYDDSEDFTNISAGGLCGVRWHETQEFDEGADPVGYYTVDVTMRADVPYPVKNLAGDYHWGVTVGAGVSLTVQKVYFSSGVAATYVMNPGTRYLGIDHLGGQGVGEGGSVPAADISIATHF